MSPLTFAIGDVHGCFDMLQSLLRACEAHAAGRPGRYVFLGDYIDRGSDSRGVIQLLMRLHQAQPGTHVCLRGNHEQMAIRAHESALALPLWLQNGGAATRCNYSGTNGRIEDSHLAWLRTLPFCYDDGLRFFVHAGIDLAKPLDEQSNEGMLWMREPFLSHCDEVDCGRFIGSIATYGTYTFADKTLKVKVDHSTYANWNGAEQTRTLVVTGDEMKWSNPAGSAGGVAELVFKRAPKATH